jgi:hypothetical protein
MVSAGKWTDILMEQYRDQLSKARKLVTETMYVKELDTLKEYADRAFRRSEGGNCILFARSDEIAREAVEVLETHLTEKYQDPDLKIALVTINPILCKSEELMVTQIFNAIGQQGTKKYVLRAFNSSELRNYINEKRNIGVFIVLENLEVYAQAQRQGLLYKLFDMLHYGPIRLFVLAISKNIAIVDSFEKRIRSRYSHRSLPRSDAVDRSCSTRLSTSRFFW